MKTFLANNKEYIDVNDILKIIIENRTNNPKSKTYKSVKSKKAIVEAYNLEHVFGRIINNVLAITEKYSMKHGSIFITKELFDLTFGDKPEKLDPLPNLLEDEDLVFFKDKEGNEYHVEMRGERKYDKIYFKVNDLMNVFENKNLHDNIIDKRSSYIGNEDYHFFINPDTGSSQEQAKKELFVSYNGLMKIINNSKKGIAKQFKKYIDEVVFSSFWGTQDQKIETCKKILNVDAEQLKSLMSKTSADICCLYLIDIKKNDTEGHDINLYKYGFTEKIKRRFVEHIKTFGNNITLDQFIMIPKNMLSQAETEFKNCISNYSIPHNESDEIIKLNKNSYGNIKNIFKVISDKYCGEQKDLIQSHQKEITEYKHQIELHRMELKNKDTEIELYKMKLEKKDTEIELLELKLKFAKMN